MKLDFFLLDVFTTERLKGNPLAVVLKADYLLDDQMQAIAAEFNLSETVFVTEPKSERHTAALRIFTPRTELPFAGHPTIGAAVALGLVNRASAVRLEEKVGVITCVLEQLDKRSGYARFGLPRLPTEVGPSPDKPTLALALGINAEDIGCGVYEPAVMSAGLPFYLVPVRDADVLRQLRLEQRGWQNVFTGGHGQTYVFTLTPDERNNDLAARMFAPAMGIAEDPATGSAAAALIGLLSRHAPDGMGSFRLRQGVEMGRPSQISIQFRKDGGTLTHGSIGGHVVVTARGLLDLDA